MSIHPKDVLFYAGGECLQKFGVPFMRQTRAQDVAATFTRSGAAPFVDSDGVLRDAGANRLRTTWSGSSPMIAIEGANTNIVTSDNIAGLSAQGTPVITGSISDPAGGTGAYTVEDNDGSSGEYPIWPLSFTGDGVKTVSFVVRENTVPSEGNQDLSVFDDSIAALRLFLRLPFDGWTDGEPTVTASVGTLIGKLYLGNGYWMIRGQTTSVTAANTNQAWVQAAAVAGGGTGSIDVYRVNAFDNDMSPLLPLDASGSVSAETLYAPFFAPPQVMTVYVKFVEQGTVHIGGGGLVHIGAGNNSTDPRLLMFEQGGFYAFRHDNGTTSLGSQLAAAPSAGDSVELRGVLAADGSVQLGQSIGGATETLATASAAVTLQPAWADNRLYVGSLGTASQGVNPIAAVKVVRGVQSMADMRAVYS